MNQAAATPTLPNLCKHCDSPLARNQTEFCCSGCATAFEIISGGGWSQYYQVRDSGLGRPIDAADGDLDFAYLDTEDYRLRHCVLESDRFEATWYLEGLQCGACSWLVEEVCRKQEGIREVALNFGEGRLQFVCGPDAKLSGLAAVLARLGYVAGLDPQETKAPRGSLLKLGLVGALAANLMLMSVPFYLGLEQGSAGVIFGVLSLVLALPLLLYGAREFYTRAWYSIIHRLPGLDLPIALGLSGAFLLSTYNLSQGFYEGMYFDSMGMLVFFLLLGKNAREAGIHKALAAGRRLLARMPQMVEVLRASQWLSLPASQLVPGDLVRLKGGNVLPVDAILESDEAVLNLNVVSGEARPVTLTRGASMLAGSINIGGELQARATSTFSDSRFARLEAQAHGLKAQRQPLFGSPLAFAFLVFTLAAACFGAAQWWSVSPLKALTVGLTVLIVVCPCALALAEPVAQAFALKYAASLGIWVKDQDLFDQLTRIRHVVFDKTGILTSGTPRVAVQEVFSQTPHWLESAVIALESQVNHPLAQAFRGLNTPHLAIERISDVQVVAGAGIRGVVDGVEVVVGAPKRLVALGIDSLKAAEIQLRAEGLAEELTQVAVLVNGRLEALYGLEDEVRPEVAPLCQGLSEMGLDLAILSGDQQRAVTRVGEALGIGSRMGDLLPEDKLAYLQSHEPELSLMAGDGFNDMGALARAGVGLTHAFASEAALRFASVIFKDRQMGRLLHLFELARTTRRGIRWGVGVSLCYNLVAVVLAVFGLISPLGAALLMPLSSLSLIGVVGLTFHRGSRRWGS